MGSVKRALPLERDVQRAVITLFRACGAVVYVTSQGYRKDPGGTRMTAGLPDLLVFFPRLGKLLFFEVKRPGGKRTPAQIQFGHRVEDLEDPWVIYGWGGLEEAKTIMRAWRMIP